ncbi:MAG: aconitate hydratase [Methanobacteriota archaeon]|nr:MAG: aconitate hydratase [Euryarchaeota archaeon]
MAESLARQLIRSHLAEGKMDPGEVIALKMDQALLQDATGTLAWLQFEQMERPSVTIRQATQYIDHNILQTGYENADDHRFLRSVCQKYGAVFSGPGNGISHWAHMEAFDIPGETMLGCDSHTPHAGACGMLAIGAGGFEVANVMAGEPYRVTMPEVVNVRLTGKFKPWVSAKDVILELLHRFDVKWGRNKVLEYTGPGLKELAVPARGTIANMGTELGATASIFPSDPLTKQFLTGQARGNDFHPLTADASAGYDDTVDIELGELEPLIACPSSPDNVKPVREVAGTEVAQVAVGSSVNSSFRDLSIVAHALDGKHTAPGISVAVSPGSRQTLLLMLTSGLMTKLIKAGVRELEVACGPCIGMGFAPPTRGPSVRTFNRNFEGRSGTPDDLVYLCSPETAAATALEGEITDPRDLGTLPTLKEPTRYPVDTSGFEWPPKDRSSVQVIRGPNIAPLPMANPPKDTMEGEVLIRLGDNVSTDHIMPAGAKILPLRSNIPAIAEHVFEYVDPTFPERAKKAGGGFIVAGDNYGQGSSREHAAVAPMFLGVQLVLAKSFARIHLDNLVNSGIPPVTFANPNEYEGIQKGDRLRITNVLAAIRGRGEASAEDLTRGTRAVLRVSLRPHQREVLLAGGGIRYAHLRVPR